MTEWYTEVPMMFQAQTEGRCQLQRVIDQCAVDAQKWTKEWTQEYPQPVTENDESEDSDIPIWKRRPAKPKSKTVEIKPPQFGKGVKSREYTINWRMVTDSGQDAIIRPIIGAKGYPYYPGASMKGAFRRACNSQQVDDYCGKKINNGEDGTEPGILRFHGGYPVDTSWTKDLVDVVHPQQEKQVIDNSPASEKVQIALQEVKIRFGISATKSLKSQEWEKIWAIWERALGQGLGSRVSAGYGYFKETVPPQELLQVHLKGQGIASTLLDDQKTPEFRPNMFKAALRGHTLRLLGGMTDAETAKYLTQILWGGINGKAVWGLLGVAFDWDEKDFKLNKHKYRLPVYDLDSGIFHLFCTRSQMSPEEHQELKAVAKALLQFAMVFGGFGKSWRRVEHRIFYPEYLQKKNKTPIGCHWSFLEESKAYCLPINSLPEDVSKFIDRVRSILRNWATKTLEKKDKQLGDEVAKDWREAWYRNQVPQKKSSNSTTTPGLKRPKPRSISATQGGVQIWGRIARNKEDSKAIYYFHDQDYGIKKTNLTGKLGNTGRMWHRMYPHYQKNEQGEIQATNKYVELLTIFPDKAKTTQDFLKFLREETDFQKLW